MFKGIGISSKKPVPTIEPIADGLSPDTKHVNVSDLELIEGDRFNTNQAANLHQDPNFFTAKLDPLNHSTIKFTNP
jgi:hypothetical protein